MHGQSKPHHLFLCGFRNLDAFLLYMACNAVLAGSAAAICAYLAPAAAGSGIPEVKAYLNGVDAHSILAPSTLFVKVRPPSNSVPIRRRCMF